jgi:hypothetical protein
MPSGGYAVVWSDGCVPAAAGKLTLGSGGLSLEGRDELELRYADVAGVRMGRAPEERLGGRPAVVLERHDGSSLRLASTVGVGTQSEIVERLGEHLDRYAAASTASAASTRPTSGANLNPCPEQAEPTTTRPRRSSTNSSSSRLV